MATIDAKQATAIGPRGGSKKYWQAFINGELFVLNGEIQRFTTKRNATLAALRYTQRHPEKFR